MGRIGVITNPRSRVNLGDPGLHGRLEAALGDAGELAAPDSLDALADVLVRWRDDGVRTVAVNGGDGSVHRVVTALVRTWGEDALPRLAILPSGTMNIVATSLGIRGRPAAVLRRLVAAEPQIRTAWLMRVTGDGPPVYGFLFGNGIISRFLEVYYEGSAPTPAKAAWILGRGALSAVVGGKAIRRLTRPFEGTLEIDGTALDGTRWTAIAAGTVEQLGLGFRAFPLINEHPGKMHVNAIGGTVVDLARDLHRAYRGVPLARPGNRTFAATSLVVRGEGRVGYMVDGDFHEADGGVRVEIGPPIQIAVP